MADRLTRREVLRWTGAGTGVAALGGVGTASAQSDMENTLTLQHPDLERPDKNWYQSGPIEYEFEVRNEVTGSTERGVEFDDSDYIVTTDDGTTVVGGFVGQARDRYLYSGELDFVRFGATDRPRVERNGTAFDPTDDIEQHTLLIGTDGEPARFGFEVESGLERSDAFVKDLRGDTVSGNVATGFTGGIGVRRGRKTYFFEGELVRLMGLGGDIVIVLDGRRVDPRAVVDNHTLTIEKGDETARRTSLYEFEVQGDLRRSTLRSSSNPTDTIDGTVATGNVVDHRDSYIYTGDLLRFESYGAVRTRLDGRALDLDPQRLTLTGTGDPTAYDFEVRNDVPGVATDLSPGLQKVAPSPAEPADTVDGTAASGVVIDGRDTYEFTGDLHRFTAEAPVDVELDGEEIRPMDVVEEHTVTYSKGSNSADASELKYRLEIEDAETFRLDDALNAKTTDRELDGHVPGGEGVGKVRENFARGAVFGNRDSYVFSGKVVWSDAGDAVDIILDGEAVTDGQLQQAVNCRRRNPDQNCRWFDPDGAP